MIVKLEYAYRVKNCFKVKLYKNFKKMIANEDKIIFQNIQTSKKYNVIKPIGQGGYSNVFLVEEEISKRK